MIGTIVDQYRIVSRIAGGGMGDVYKAIDLELQREVAIKCVRPELSDLEEVAKRFRNEARTLARLSHPNIATVYRFFTDAERLFLVMEYIDGTPFGGKLKGLGGLPFEEAVWMVRDSLHGLGYAHEHGVVHRDIKPGNLMLDQRNTVKVLDFGVAHLIGGTRLTRAGSVVGTPAYMAPEQILGKPVDARTDLYSIGIVLYELLSGQLPYQGDSEFELMRSHLEKAPPPLRSLTGSNVPQLLQDTVERALNKEQSERFQSAAEFDAALEEAISRSERTVVNVSRTAVVPPPPPPAEPTTAAARFAGLRLTPVTWAVGVAGVLAVVLGGYFLFGGGDSPQYSSGSDGVVSAPSMRDLSPTAADPSRAIPLTGMASGSTSLTLGLAGSAQDSQADLQETAPVPGATSPLTGVPSAAANRPQPMATQPAPLTSQPPASIADTQGRRPVNEPARPDTTPPVPRVGATVTPIKVAYHDKQGTGRFSREVGYNGAFTLNIPRGAGTTLRVDEVVEVYKGGRLVATQAIKSEARRAGTFKSKERIPGIKQLAPGAYDIKLLFMAEGRTLGSYKWRVQVVD
ncbi:MAG: protein kinase [Pseudomonadales bacterium]|nr:protein kinase [Pseudomonadales bacterium]